MIICNFKLQPRRALAKLSLLKVLLVVENERFTVEIDSESAILDCTLER